MEFTLKLILFIIIVVIIVEWLMHHKNTVIEYYFLSQYGNKMTKLTGEKCEYPTECESLACIEQYTINKENQVFTDKKCL